MLIPVIPMLVVLAYPDADPDWKKVSADVEDCYINAYASVK